MTSWIMVTLCATFTAVTLGDESDVDCVTKRICYGSRSGNGTSIFDYWIRVRTSCINTFMSFSSAVH